MDDVNALIRQGFRNTSERIRTLESLQYPHPKIYEAYSNGSVVANVAVTNIPGAELVLPPGVYAIDGIFVIDATTQPTNGLTASGYLRLNNKTIQANAWDKAIAVGATSGNPRSQITMRWIVTLWDYRQLVLVEAPDFWERFHEFITVTGAASSIGTFQGNPTPLSTPAIGSVDMDGQNNYSMLFDGTNDYINGISNTNVFYNSNRALEIWFNTSRAQVQYLIGNITISAPTGVSGKGAGMYINASGQVVAGLGVSGGAVCACNSPLAYNNGRWHHAIMSWDASTLHLYVDGVEVASVAAVVPTSGGAPVNAAIAADTAGANFFGGYLDEAVGHSSYQTAQQVKDRYNAGTSVVYYPSTLYPTEVLADAPVVWWRYNEADTSGAIDSSGNGRTGTLAGNVVINQPGALIVEKNGLYDDAYYLDGSTAYISRVDETAFHVVQGSVEAWFKSGTNGVQYLIGNCAMAPPYNGVGIILDTPTGGHVSGMLGNAVANNVVAAALTYNDGAWHHVVFTWDGGTLCLYIDGALVNTAAQTIVPTFTNNPWRVGYDPTGLGYRFAGTVDETALYNSVLSATRVQTHYLVGRSNRGWLTLAANKVFYFLGGDVWTIQSAKLVATQLVTVSRS